MTHPPSPSSVDVRNRRSQFRGPLQSRHPMTATLNVDHNPRSVTAPAFGTRSASASHGARRRASVWACRQGHPSDGFVALDNERSGHYAKQTPAMSLRAATPISASASPAKSRSGSQPANRGRHARAVVRETRSGVLVALTLACRNASARFTRRRGSGSWHRAGSRRPARVRDRRKSASLAGRGQARSGCARL